MRRDMDLVRKILLTLEEDTVAKKSLKQITNIIKDYDAKLVEHHIEIMFQAGLLEKGKFLLPTSAKPPLTQTNYSLSWDGHEFIDTMRSATIWNKVKETMSKAGGFALDVALLTGKEYLKQEILKKLE